MIFGRTDLRKGVSEAKFDVEAAGDVKNSKISRKSAENREKTKNLANLFSKQKFLSPILFSIRNRLKRVLATFCGSKTAKKRRNNGEKTAKNTNFYGRIRFFMVYWTTGTTLHVTYNQNACARPSLNKQKTASKT